MSLFLFIVVIVIVIVVFTYSSIYMFMETRNNILFRPTRSDAKYEHKGKEQFIGDIFTSLVQYGDEKTKDIILFLHGNSGNISDRDYIVHFAHLCKLDIMLMDYRGYGKSKGAASIDGIRQDGIDVYDYISKIYGESGIIVMSESMGSVALSMIAATRQPKILCMICGISSFETIQKNHEMSYVMKQITKMMTSDLDKVTNCSLLKTTKSPILFIHSREDEIVPYACCIENDSVVPMNCRLGIITILGGHSTPELSEESIKRLLDVIGVSEHPSKFKNWAKIMSNIGNQIEMYRIDLP